jgi:hypothetical protein
MKRKLLNKNKYPPKCEYCAKGRLAPDGENVLCPKKGIVERDYSCKAYKYDVLKRVPQKQPRVKEIDPADYEL